MAVPEYVNQLDHPIDLADGSVLAPGEGARLSADQARDEHNKLLIDSESLVKASELKEDSVNSESEEDVK